MVYSHGCKKNELMLLQFSLFESLMPIISTCWHLVAAVHIEGMHTIC